MTTRKYSSRSQQTTLSGALTSSATTATVLSGSNLLGGATISAGETFTVVIDPDTALEEIVDVTAVSTNTLTIVRGVETAGVGQAHSAGAVVRHMVTGRDLREANQHIENTTTAHGLTLANVVKTTDTGTVSSGMIASGAVGTAKIDDAAVTETKIGTSAVTAGKIATDAVTTAKIQDSAVTSAKIADGTIVNADINTAAAITKTKISGTAITAADTGTVNSTILADLAVTTAKLVDSNVTTAKIADLNVTTGKIADSAITSAKIADATIVNADISTTAAIALSKLATDPLARANHTGTQTASTISDFDTQVRTSRLDQMTAPTADISLATHKVTNLGTPTVSTDASTKGYVDSQITALVGGAPGTLDTLNEIAAAINNSGSFATSVVLRDGTQAMTGALAMGSNKITGLGTPTASTDAVTKAYADAILVGAPGNLTGPITSVGAATSVASQTGTGSTFVMNTSPTIITPVITASSTTDALRITNTGTGNSLLVEDSATTDSTPFVIDANGTTILGATAALTSNVVSGTSKLQIIGSSTVSSIGLTRLDPSTPVISFNSGSGGSNVSSGNAIMNVSAGGYDGTSYALAGTIEMRVDGTVSTGIVPGRIAFLTANSSGTNTERMRIDSAGGIGIGAAASAGTTLRIGKNLTGAVTSFGIYNNNAIQSDVTTSAQLFSTFPSVVDASFTLGSLIHYGASQGTKGASATITNQYGYYVDNSLTAATNNFGFFGGIASGTARWNLYMSGTADNYLAGALGIGVTSLTGYSLRVTKNITGAATAYGVVSSGAFQSDVTSGYLFSSYGQTQSANFTLTTLAHFRTTGDTTFANVTAGGAVTNQFGFLVESTLTGATNNYGFYGNLAAASNVRNIYIAGTAANYFAGQTTVGSTSLTLGSGSVAQQFGVVSTAASNVGVVIRGAASQTGDLTQWQNSAGTVLAKIDASGNTTINSIAAGTTSTAAVGGGYMGLPQNSTTTGAYTVVAADAGKHIYSTATRTVTIDSNANLALPVGTTLTFISGVGATTTIAITTDTMYLAGTGTTGSRTLAAYGMATAVKIASTTWIISGNGLT